MCALFWSLALASCAGPTIKAPNATPCTAAGRLYLGLDCSEINTGKISSLSYQEGIDFLEPQGVRECVPVPGFSVCADDQSVGEAVKLEARAGAIIESDDDFTAQKSAFEQACEELHDRCTPEMRAPFSAAYEQVQSLLIRAVHKKGL